MQRERRFGPDVFDDEGVTSALVATLAVLLGFGAGALMNASTIMRRVDLHALGRPYSSEGDSCGVLLRPHARAQPRSLTQLSGDAIQSWRQERLANVGALRHARSRGAAPVLRTCPLLCLIFTLNDSLHRSILSTQALCSDSCTAKRDS